MRILIVEDSKFTRALLRRELAPIHEVLEASDGQEGLELLREARPDLVLVDLLMPLLDGFEFLERARREAADVPIVVCSANTQPSVEARIRELGGTKFVAKPELLVAGRARALVAELVPTSASSR